MKTRIWSAWLTGLVVAPMMALMSSSPAQIATNRPHTSATDSAAVPSSTARPADTEQKPALPPEVSAASVQERPAVPASTASNEIRLPSADLRLSYWTGEIMKLARAGIDDDVLLSFIDSVGTFNLSANDIIELNDIGVSGEIISTMIRHDSEVAAGLRVVTASASLPTIHITFSPNNEIPARSTAPAPAAAVPTTVATSEGNVPARERMAAYSEAAVPKLSAADYTVAAEPGPETILISNPPTPAPERKRPLYAVREPYPEAITPPIVIIRAPGLTPNMLVIEWSH